MADNELLELRVSDQDNAEYQETSPEEGTGLAGELGASREGGDSSDEKLLDLTEVDKEFDWEVTPELAEYFAKNAKTFIPTKVIKEKILDEYPVPKNLPTLPKLDSAIATVIPEGHTAISQVESLGTMGNMGRCPGYVGPYAIHVARAAQPEVFKSAKAGGRITP